MLVALNNKNRIEAEHAEKGPDYVCPNCKADVILRKGRVRIHHFAHKAASTCPFSKSESQAHYTAKIHRSQQPDGTLKPFTKTDAGMREIPINSILLGMMKDWQERCPRHKGKLHRVFPAQGSETNMGGPPGKNSDGGLSMYNYRNRVWYPMLKRLGLPQIGPYAARHMVISFLQAQGVEVGLVAKIVGHASPQITLQYYTHAVREHDGMMDELNAAYGVDKPSADTGTGVQI